jgi:hypothetical protein
MDLSRNLKLMTLRHSMDLSRSLKMKTLRKESKQKPKMLQSQDKLCTRRPACMLAHIDSKTWVWAHTQVTLSLNTAVLESDDIAASPAVLVQNDSWRVQGRCCTAVLVQTGTAV